VGQYPSTHWQQSRQHGNNRQKKSTFDFVADTLDFVANLSLVSQKSTVTGSFDFVLNMFDSVDFVKVGDFCRPNVEHPFDFVTTVYGAKAIQSRKCQIRFGRQCVPGFRVRTSNSWIRSQEYRLVPVFKKIPHQILFYGSKKWELRGFCPPTSDMPI